MYSSDNNHGGAGELSSGKELKLVPISISIINKTAAEPGLGKAFLAAPQNWAKPGSSHVCPESTVTV